MLEEPAANIFPYAFEWFAERVKDTVKHTYVVITTHNPLMASELLDKIRDVKVYYVDRKETTQLYECDLDKMISDLVTVKDLLYVPEQWRKYCRTIQE